MPSEVSAQGATGQEPEQALCAAHAETPAVSVCSRCGTFLCAACGVPFESTVLCPACFERYAREPGVSSQAWTCLCLGLGGLTCGFLPGIVGLVLAYRELERIRLGESSPGGRAVAQAGQLLGWLNVALLLLVSMVLVSQLLE